MEGSGERTKDVPHTKGFPCGRALHEVGRHLDDYPSLGLDCQDEDELYRTWEIVIQMATSVGLINWENKENYSLRSFTVHDSVLEILRNAYPKYRDLVDEFFHTVEPILWNDSNSNPLQDIQRAYQEYSHFYVDESDNVYQNYRSPRDRFAQMYIESNEACEREAKVHDVGPTPFWAVNPQKERRKKNK